MNSNWTHNLLLQSMLVFSLLPGFYSCGTSTIGNPGSSSLVQIDENGQNPGGVLFRCTFDSTGNSWDLSVERSKQIITPVQPQGDTLATVGDRDVYYTGGAGEWAVGGVEYRFVFISGDSVYSDWQNDSTVTRIWSIAENCTISAQARSMVDTAKISYWSIPLLVKIK